MIDHSTTPSALAAVIASALQRIENDAEVATVLAEARSRLERIAWARFARQTQRESIAGSIRHRHQVMGSRRVVLGSYVRKPRELWIEERPIHA